MRLIQRLLLTATLTAFTYAQTGGEVALRAAIETETVKGDIKDALRQYSEIAAKYAKADHATAASALIHMAECYEKMGAPEARKILEQVVREYSDQKEAVAKARARLGNPLPRANAMSARQAWRSSASACCYASADGRFLVFVNSANRELGLHDLNSGADRSLVKADKSEPGYFTVPAVSKDGRTVAYGWVQINPVRGGVRLANVSGEANPRTLFENADLQSVEPRDWSADGKWIAAELRRKDRTAQIALISVSDGSVRVLKSVDWRGTRGMFFSPDSRNLAYDLPAGDGATQRYIFVLAADGSGEATAVVDPNDELVMGWSPDGQQLLFASDRGGSFNLFALRIADGKPHGSALLVKTDLGNPQPIGVTAAGALYWKSRSADMNIGIVALDLESGKLVGNAAKPVKSFGANRFPIWSPDGKRIAYVASRGDGFSDPSLAILSLESGRVQEVRPKLEQFMPFSWAPDGRSIAVVGPDLKGRYGIHQLDVDSGEAVAIRVDTDPENPTGFQAPEWSRDGKQLYYTAFRGRFGTSALLARDMASGEDRQLEEIRGRYGAIQASPDGQWIVAPRSDAPMQMPSAVLVIPTGQGASRKVLQVDSTQMVMSFGWTRDSRAVIVGKCPTGNPNDPELWLVSLDGGQARKLEAPRNVTQMISVSPDNRQIAYTIGHFNTLREVWVLENFLPNPSANR